jgi:hypothetical protein
MKRYLILLLFTTLYNISNAQCNAPGALYTSSIYYFNADVNWNTTNDTHHYKIRYKITGASNWSYKNNIDSLLTTKSLANLIPLNEYIWQIRSHCDSTGPNYSFWSVIDTFYTNTSALAPVNGLYTNGINYNNAIANWTTNQSTDRYRVHYRIYGTTNWQNLATVNSTTNNILLPLLQQNTTYEWEVMAYYDSTNQMASLWSAPDTFTTTAFVAATFNPVIINTIDNSFCNTTTSLTLTASQAQNEPDIGTSTITSDGGYFDIQSVAMGDSVGYAIMNTSTQTISTTLRVGIIAGQNYAIINSYDSSGSLMGFFAIENVNAGIKVSSTSPNDGNNYTSGFTSEIHFSNLFVTPNIDGPLHFYADIQSELGDQFNQTNTIMITCTNSILEEMLQETGNYTIYDLFGRSAVFKKNRVLVYKYSNGETKKKITIK